MSSRSVRKVKRKLKSRAKVFLVLILLILVAFGVYYAYSNNILFNKKDVVEKPKKEEKKEEVKQPKEYRASIFMVGDALIHWGVYNDALVNGVYDFKPMLQFIKPISSKYDLAYYNQETILGGEL